MKSKEEHFPTVSLNREALSKEVSDLLDLTRKTLSETTSLLEKLNAISDKATALDTQEIQLEHTLIQQLNEFTRNAEEHCLRIKQHLETTNPLC